MKEKKRARYSDLVKMDKHPHYYVNPLSGKITYRRMHQGVNIKIPTGETSITKAKTFVEVELEKRRSGQAEKTIKRKLKGISNPFLEDLWQDFIDETSAGLSENTRKNYAKNWKHGLRGFWGRSPAPPTRDQFETDKAFTTAKDKFELDRKKYPHAYPKGQPKTLSDLTASNFAKFKAWYIETHPERVYVQTDANFKVFLSYLVTRKIASPEALLFNQDLSDLDAIIRSNSKREAVGRVYTPDEREKLLVAWKEFLPGGTHAVKDDAQSMVYAARARLGVSLSLKRGPRMKEILAIELSWIDFKRKVVKIWSFKNKKKLKRFRELSLDDDLIEAFKFQIQATKYLNSKFLFPATATYQPKDGSKPNEPAYISNQIFEKTWYKVRAIAGIVPRWPRDARFHDLRKTCATITAELGWPVKVACEMLDMSIAKYEKIYANNVGVGAQAKWTSKMFEGSS